MLINLDPWQAEFLEYKGNKMLISGRQTGKSEAAGYDNGEFALNNPGTTALIISKTERQAEELLIKTLSYLQDKAPERIGTGKWKPLKHCVYVMEKGKKKKDKQKPARVICLPTGFAGEGIKGLTIHKLTVDEAQLPEDDVFYNILPMLLTTGGPISLIGTPRGKKGFFWKAFNGELGDWKKWHIDSESVITARPISPTWPEWRKENAIKFLEQERHRLPAKWFDQEYRGMFIEPVDRLFPTDLIKACAILKRRTEKLKERLYFMGVDVGRTIDPSTFEVFDASAKIIMQVENIVRKEYSITKTAQMIEYIDQEYNYISKVGIDGRGIGAGVVDILLDSKIKRKIVDLDNAKRAYEYGEGAGQKILLKEDMYLYLLNLMLQGKVQFLDDQDLIESLESVHVEYKEGDKKPIIVALDNHIVEGIIRAVYLTKGKKLNTWIRSIRI